MFVAKPTAIPDAPFTSKLGNLPGKTSGSFKLSSKFKEKLTVSLSISRKSSKVSGSILASVWLPDVKMPVVDSLGDEFLNYVKDGMTITIGEDGIVTVE